MLVVCRFVRHSLCQAVVSMDAMESTVAYVAELNMVMLMDAAGSRPRRAQTQNVYLSPGS